MRVLLAEAVADTESGDCPIFDLLTEYLIFQNPQEILLTVYIFPHTN